MLEYCRSNATKVDMPYGLETYRLDDNTLVIFNINLDKYILCPANRS